MKKNYFCRLTLVLVLCLSFVFMGCGNSQTSGNHSEDNSATDNQDADQKGEEETSTSDNEKPKEVETISVGVWADDEAQRLTAAFDGMEETEGVKVEIMRYPSDSDFWDNIPTQIAVGTAPDLISCTNEHYLQSINAGLFEKLNSYIDDGKISIDGIDQVAMDAWTIDGNVYGIPFSENPGIFIINDTMWKKFGLGDQYPTTWDVVLAICKKVKEEQNMPALCLNIQEYHLTNYAISFGGGWGFGKTINAPENAEALQFIIDAYKQGYVVTPTELGVGWDGAVMLQQSALFSTGGAWYKINFDSEAPDIQLKYLSIPKGGNGNGSGTLHTNALVALTKSKHPDAVATAFEYAFKNESLFEKVIDVTQCIPTKEEYKNDFKEKLPELSMLVDFIPECKPFSYPSESKKFADELISLMQEALFDNNSTLTGQEIVNQLAEKYATP